MGWTACVFAGTMENIGKHFSNPKRAAAAAAAQTRNLNKHSQEGKWWKWGWLSCVRGKKTPIFWPHQKTAVFCAVWILIPSAPGSSFSKLPGWCWSLSVHFQFSQSLPKKKGEGNKGGGCRWLAIDIFSSFCRNANCFRWSLKSNTSRVQHYIRNQ